MSKSRIVWWLSRSSFLLFAMHFSNNVYCQDSHDRGLAITAIFQKLDSAKNVDNLYFTDKTGNIIGMYMQEHLFCGRGFGAISGSNVVPQAYIINQLLLIELYAFSTVDSCSYIFDTQKSQYLGQYTGSFVTTELVQDIDTIYLLYRNWYNLVCEKGFDYIVSYNIRALNGTKYKWATINSTPSGK
ncbi:MAG: hypothetical protein RL660_31 [Bacteroidota bacterium]|jgi:hypothetical protein